jgi:cytochrome c553
MKRRGDVVLVLAVAVSVISVSCSRVSRHAGPGLDSVMIDIGRRFEIAGRAAAAGEFELAAFEANELEGTFRYVVPDAQMPQAVPVAHIPAMASAFVDTYPGALKRAAQAKDGKAFAEAFASAAAACNACHQASARPFIRVPSQPGRSVPDLDRSPPPAQ